MEPKFPEPSQTAYRVKRTNLTLAAILFAATLGSIVAWTLSAQGLDETGLYFIGVPGLAAAILALMPGNENGSISATRGATIAILASAIVVREGFICVLLALPLIIPVIALVVWSARQFGNRTQVALALPLLLLGVSTEGAVYDWPTNLTASETRTVQATGDQLQAALDGEGQLPTVEPLLLQLPFPKPQSFTGAGSALGDERVINFNMGSMKLEVTDRTEQSLRWTVVENTTPIGNWMSINHIDAHWIESGAGTEVTIKIDADRRLAPAGYFHPLQQWGLGEMAEVLQDMVALNL